MKTRMKMRSVLYISVLIVSAALFLQCSGQPNPPQGILKYLPEENEDLTWKPVGEAQTAEGEDLFLLINGGAEIYYEYGFLRAAIRSYKSDSGLSLNIEIYEMEDPSSAYGVFSFKTGRNGQEVDIGSDSALEDYYLNFWKNRFVITLIGFDDSQSTREALIGFARRIEQKIPDGDERPLLLNHLPTPADEDARIVYLEGNLALYNQYEFATENIFRIQKGAVGFYKDLIVFLFEYSSPSDAYHWFENACTHLKESQRFHGFEMSTQVASLVDRDHNHLFMAAFQNFILISLGKDPSKAKEALEKLEEDIQRN